MALTLIPSIDALDDARLVASCLEGNRQAYGELVERYQSPVCALAYSACGNVSQSEDLAQETFLIAWRKLRELREPPKFKSWLYGIARNLIKNSLRQQSLNPLAGAAPLDESLTACAAEANPVGRAISKEEEGILWQSLEQIPETYREPLVLFYRQQESIERVAAVLELSEEAVRQRLSRGRKLLHDRVVAFVEGALQRSAPGQAFTLSVMSALPGLTIAAGSSAVGATALKGSTAGKAAASTSLLVGGLLTKLLLPAAAGIWMGSKLPESQRERQFTRKAFGLLAVGAILYPLGLALGMHATGNYWDAHPQMLNLALLGSALGFVTVLVPYTTWISRIQIRIRREEANRCVNPGFISQAEPYEYRTPQTLLGLPLLHVRFNCVDNGKTLPAKGWIAIGDKAYGILFAFGAIAVGGISFGGFAVGLLAIGGVGLGLFAFGGISAGCAAIGGVALGYVAFGGGAVGWLGASGGATVARHFALGGGALAEHANDQAAQAFMQGSLFFRYEWTAFCIVAAMSWLLPPAIGLYFKRRRERESKAAQST